MVYHAVPHVFGGLAVTGEDAGLVVLALVLGGIVGPNGVKVLAFDGDQALSLAPRHDAVHIHLPVGHNVLKLLVHGGAQVIGPVKRAHHQQQSDAPRPDGEQEQKTEDCDD